jgi:hypothetical protein
VRYTSTDGDAVFETECITVARADGHTDRRSIAGTDDVPDDVTDGFTDLAQRLSIAPALRDSRDVQPGRPVLPGSRQHHVLPVLR